MFLAIILQEGIMAFRDLLGAASIIDEPTSILHGVFDKSKSTGHDLLVFENLVETPGHKIAVNLLTRPRLCAALSIEPEDFIDLLGWAMENPRAVSYTHLRAHET